MKDKRRLIAKGLFRIGALDVLKARMRDRIVVLNYHRIRPDGAGFSTPFHDGAYGPTAAQFEEQMLWLKGHVRLLGEAELIECAAAGRGPGELSALVTTDDGYLDNYTLAYPVLRRLGIPAVFFVPSGMIESRALGWWDRLAYLLKRTEKSAITYGGRTFDLATQRDAAFRFLDTKVIESMPDGARTVVAEIARLCEVDLPSRESEDAELMTWEHLREMSGHGIAIGSHTHSHAVLSRIDEKRQREELAMSRDLITQKVRRAARSIAYPIGSRAHFTAETKRIGRECGYDLGFSFYSGVNRWPSIDPFDVRRTEATYHDRIGVAAVTVLPELFAWPS